MLEIKCPNCTGRLQLPEDGGASECQCPICQAVFTPLRSQCANVGNPSLSDGRIVDSAAGRLHSDDDDDVAEVLAKRAQVNDENKTKLDTLRAREYRWNQSLTAGKYGFFAGLIAGVIALFFDPGGNKISPTGVGALGAAVGFVIVFLAHTPASRDPIWIEGVFVGALALCILGVMSVQWRSNLEVRLSGLIFGELLGLVVIPVLWAMITGLTFILRWSAARGMEES